MRAIVTYPNENVNKNEINEILEQMTAKAPPLHNNLPFKSAKDNI